MLGVSGRGRALSGLRPLPTLDLSQQRGTAMARTDVDALNATFVQGLKRAMPG